MQPARHISRDLLWKFGCVYFIICSVFDTISFSGVVFCKGIIEDGKPNTWEISANEDNVSSVYVLGKLIKISQSYGVHDLDRLILYLRETKPTGHGREWRVNSQELIRIYEEDKIIGTIFPQHKAVLLSVLFKKKCSLNVEKSSIIRMIYLIAAAMDYVVVLPKDAIIMGPPEMIDVGDGRLGWDRRAYNIPVNLGTTLAKRIPSVLLPTGSALAYDRDNNILVVVGEVRCFVILGTLLEAMDAKRVDAPQFPSF